MKQSKSPSKNTSRAAGTIEKARNLRLLRRRFGELGVSNPSQDRSASEPDPVMRTMKRIADSARRTPSRPSQGRGRGPGDFPVEKFCW